MKNIFTSMLILACSLAAASAQSNLAPIEAAQAITHLRQGVVDSINHGDIDRFLGFFDTNAVVTWQNGDVCEGTADLKAYYNRMVKGDHPMVSKVTIEPKVLGQHIQADEVISWGELNDNFVLSDGRQLALNSRFTATIAKRGDKWLLSSFHASVNAFANPILAVAVRKIATIGGVGGIVVGIIVGVVASGFFRRSNPAV